MSNNDSLDQLRIEREYRNDESRAPRMPWVVALLTVLSLAVAVTLWWPGERIIAVEAVTAGAAPKNSDSAVVLQASGYVTARRQATVSAQVVGTLSEVAIEEGDHVEKGQVLARLEDSSQLARLNEARANLGAARAQVDQVRTQLEQAQRESDRQKALVAREQASAQDAEKAQARAEALAAQLGSAKAQAAAAQARTGVAKVNLDHTVVRAPFAGVVTQKAAQVGEIIAPSTAGGGFTRTGVGTIVDMGSLEIEVDVNEAYVSRVRPGMMAEAVLEAYPDWVIPARVIAIVPTADRAKATVKVRVALEQKDDRILPDMGARVSFMDSAREGTDTLVGPTGVLIPASAIVEREGRQAVFVIEDDIAQSREVQVSDQQFGNLRLVLNGVEVGATVVDKPPGELVDDMEVNGVAR